ncbi:MAG TPA: transporter [Sphingomicrobium sp.]
MIAAMLLAAAATTGQQPICPDRPSKANGACTVPAGHVQLETGLIDWTRDKTGGVRSDLVQWGGTFVKYGLGPKSDIELGITPLETLGIRSGGQRDRASGFGDIAVRWKRGLTDESAPMQAAAIPFIKLPTAAHGLGNGKVEAGITVPVSAALGKTGLTVTLGPELDLKTDADGHGYHAAMAQLINFGLTATSRLSLSGELWAGWDWDPRETSKQASADASVAYLVTSDFQLDAGTNFGLNPQTADLELYAGVSKRF